MSCNVKMADVEVSFLVGLTSDSLNEADVIKFLRSDECGAVAMFMGTTRNSEGGRRVLALDYEAFAEMAERQLREIGEQMKQRWPGLRRVALRHRLGQIAAGETSVIVAASSPHRRHALDAVDFGIEQIKAVVAIWKKEIYEDGENVWKENKECAWAHNYVST